MENRLQYFLLTIALSILLSANNSFAQQFDGIDGEFFELGISAGIINVENFPSSSAVGLAATFRATEDFFLQLNYLTAGDLDLSSYEKSQGAYTGDRRYTHYDLLLGVNVFQGEVFTRGSSADLSSLYIVAGIGEVEYLDENSFAYTLGLGYRMAFNRRYIWHIDFRNTIYDASLISGQDEKTLHNSYFATGISYLF